MQAVKIISLFVGGTIAFVIIGVCYFLFVDYLAYKKVEITTALVREGKYEPARHFAFDRACTFPPESGLAYDLLSQRGYREIDAIVPDTFTNWTLVLIDDSKKTFRTLYVLDPVVKFDRIVCSPQITLRTKMSDGHLTAYVEEAKAN